MKSYVFRRRFNPAAVGNENVKIFLPKGFGTPKFGISFFTNGGEAELLDETTLDRSFGIGFIGLGTTNNALHAWNASTGFTHAATVTNTHRKSVGVTTINGRFGTEARTDRNVIRQCTSPAFFEDRFEFTLSNSIASSSYFDLVMVLFSGDDIDARIGYVPLGLTNGTTSTITGMAFAPDVVLTLGTGFGLGLSGEDARFCFGCALKGSTIKNSASLFRMRSNPDGTAGISTTVHQYFSTDRCYLAYGTGANSNSLALADVTAFTSDGFTVTSRSTFFNNATNVMMYIALRCTTPGAFDLQNFTSSTSTGVVGTATSNFIPSLILGAFGSATSTGATITSNDSTGYSVFAAKSLSSKSIYGPGTISVSSGSTSVTGTGTSFKQFSPGDKIFNATNVEVGTVSYVSSDTSLFIASNASSTITTQAYSTLPKLEFSANIGSSNLSSPTKIFSGLLPAPIYSAIYGTSSSASEIVDGLVNNFDSYPGFKVNYLTANATGRKGWFLAIKDTELRRRDGN
jgi:hypothetical protein